jgi:hypothetical protein
MIRATLIDKQSPFLGEECALCKHPFAPEEEIVICPEDGSRHHARCWQANGNKCTAYGCLGSGEVITTQSDEANRQLSGGTNVPAGGRLAEGPPARSKIRVLPSSSLGCAQSCLLLSIAVAIILISVSCFGLWAIADYVMLEKLGWQYRAPLSGSIWILHFWPYWISPLIAAWI